MNHRWDDPIKRRGSQAKISARHRRAVLARDGACMLRYPGCTLEAEQVDHIIPVAEGGAEAMHNMQAVCIICHRRKSQAEAARGQARFAQRGKHPGDQRPPWSGG